MPKVTILIPVSPRSWRKNQLRDYLRDTALSVASTDSTGIGLNTVVVDCWNPLLTKSFILSGTPSKGRSKDLKTTGVTFVRSDNRYCNIKMTSYGQPSEVKAIQYAAVKYPSDFYLIVWPGIKLLDSTLKDLLDAIKNSPVAYGKILHERLNVQYGNPADNLFENIEPVGELTKQFKQCPVPPLFLATHQTVESFNSDLPGFFVLDSLATMLKNNAAPVFTNKVTGTCGRQLPYFSAPLSGDEGIRIAIKWKALPQKLETVKEY